MKKIIYVVIMLAILFFTLSIIINGGIYKQISISPDSVTKSIEDGIFLYQLNSTDILYGDTSVFSEFDIWINRFCKRRYYGIVPIYQTQHCFDSTLMLAIKSKEVKNNDLIIAYCSNTNSSYATEVDLGGYFLVEKNDTINEIAICNIIPSDSGPIEDTVYIIGFRFR